MYRIWLETEFEDDNGNIQELKEPICIGVYETESELQQVLDCLIETI